jgi:LPXTG-site transpeptidase (sortase) family protein
MKLNKINNLLLGLIIIINLYVIAAPLLPKLTFWWGNRGGTRQQELTRQIHKATRTPAVAQPDSVTIPSMLLENSPIQEGRDTYAELNKGVWHKWNTSTPDKGGNTVLLGHRFTYTNPRGVLYYLDKVREGDEIGLTWGGKHYLYKVASVQEVAPTDIAVEAPTTDPRLTIYTCTPLWLPHNRLVVTAKLESQT